VRGNGDSDIDGGLANRRLGATFAESLPGVTLEAIAFNPSNPDDVLGFEYWLWYPKNLFRSADGGSTWNTVAIGWTDETLNNITKIVFSTTDTNKIIVLEENEIVRTIDGGATDAIVYPVDLSMDYYYGLNASYNPSNTEEIAISTDLFPQFSTDGGATITQMKARRSTTSFLRLLRARVTTRICITEATADVCTRILPMESRPNMTSNRQIRSTLNAIIS
jgi:hypothetical protein